jgi:putative aminopeptidase FrvX
MVMKNYVDYAVEQIIHLCNIPSPSGFTRKAEQYLHNVFTSLGYQPTFTNKRAVLIDLGGEGNGLLLVAHIDTLGAMVRGIKPNGRLRLSKIGTFPENYIETENCTIHTRAGKEYSGTIQIEKSSVHVNSSQKISELIRDDTNIELVIDEKVKSKEDVRSLGINAGDFVSFDSRTIYTKSGFIKSRHLDDKASSGILIALAKYIKEKNIQLSRKTYLMFTIYEEVGHGASAAIPDNVTEMVSVDMGAVGDDLETDEFKVSICAKDSMGPYDYDLTNKFIDLAKEQKLNYAVDVYPYYYSDVDIALFAGYDLKHGLIGPGVASSHGYERTHYEGIENTLILLKEYIKS